MYQAILAALFLAHLAGIALRQLFTGNDSGAYARVEIADNRVQVKHGGGLFSSLGIWPLMFGALWAYGACRVLIRSDGILICLVAAVLATIGAFFLWIGLRTLLERRSVVIDGDRREVVVLRRFIMQSAPTVYGFGEFERIVVTPVKVSGGKASKTIFRVEFVGPTTAVAIDYSEIVARDQANRLAEAAGKLAKLPIEIRHHLKDESDAAWGVVFGCLIAMCIGGVGFFAGAFIMLGAVAGPNPVAGIAFGLFFCIAGCVFIGAGVWGAARWLRARRRDK